MQASAILLATLALCSAAPANQAMMGAEGAMTNARQVQDTLNRQLQANNGAHSNQARILAFITGADSQIDNAVATVSEALAPFTGGLSKAIGDFLLGPFVQATTNGAEVFLSNLIGGSEDMISAELAAQLTGNYSKLIELTKHTNVDSSRLQDLSQQITKTVSGKSKRETKEDQTDGGMDGFKGAITNIKQTVDTLKDGFNAHDGHVGKDTVNALITGLDSQIDNLAATLSKGLNGVTLGLSGEIGDFLLGPLFQSITNGAEVMISNVIGGGIDIVTDGAAKLFSNSLSQLHNLGVKYTVKTDTLDNLSKVQKKIAHLKAPKKNSKAHSKRATDADLSGAHGSMTNYQQVQDTLNHQLQSHNGHAAQAAINAFITGADSQIDNAVATVSDALAPFTGGLSKAIGDFLLGPFVQATTNGAEVVISNLVGGAIDAASGAELRMYSQTLSQLSKNAARFGVKDTSKLDAAQQKIDSLINKSQ